MGERLRLACFLISLASVLAGLTIAVFGGLNPLIAFGLASSGVATVLAVARPHVFKEDR